MRKKTKHKIYGHGNIVDVCTSRNGRNCKSCPFYGIVCVNWLKFHHMTKPCDHDSTKHQILGAYFSGDKSQYINNATKTRGEKHYGTFKKENRRKRSY